MVLLVVAAVLLLGGVVAGVGGGAVDGGDGADGDQHQQCISDHSNIINENVNVHLISKKHHTNINITKQPIMRDAPSTYHQH